MKNKSFNWVSFCLIILGLFLIIRSIIIIHGALDVNFHNTYFVVANMHIGIGMGISLLIISGIYWMFVKLKRPMNKTLSYIHLGLIIVSLAIMIPIRFPGIDSVGPRRYFSFVSEKKTLIDWNDSEVINKVISISAYLFLLGILVMGINIILCLIRKKKIQE